MGFVLTSGDMVNAYPSGPKANIEAMDRQISSLKEILREVHPEIPLVFQPGNHDISDQPFPADIEHYKTQFGDDYFSFWVGGVFYLSINSLYYVDDTNTKEEARKHNEWIEQQLLDLQKLDKPPKHVVFCSHHPPFVASEDEMPGWANWPKEPRERLLELATKAGAKLWLAGHFHGESSGISRGGVEVVVSASCGT